MNDVMIEAEVASTYDDGTKALFSEEALFVLMVLSPGTDITGESDGQRAAWGRVESASIEGEKVVVQAVIFASHEGLFRQYPQVWLVPKIEVSEENYVEGTSTIHSLALVDYLLTTSPADSTLAPVEVTG